MSRIVVTPLSQLAAQIAFHRPSHVMTLTSGEIAALPAGCKTNRLSLIFNDIAEPRDGLVAPDASHVHRLIDFAQGWPRKAPLLIHCYAGISRSTAAAYIAALALDRTINEHYLASRLRSLSPSATPNIRLISIADGILGRQGRMVEAIKAIGRGAEAFEGETFSIELS